MIGSREDKKRLQIRVELLNCTKIQAMFSFGHKSTTALLFLLTLCTTAFSQQPLRVAVAGVTHDHLGGVVNQLRQGDIQVVGVWEADSRYLHDNALSQHLPAELFYDKLDEMLDMTRPEAVVAYGSIKEHLAVVEACAPRRIHVMVEKPLATSYQEALKMAGLARQYGIQLLTNYETSWYPSLHELRARSRRGSLGAINRIEVYDGHQGPIEIGCSKKFTNWLTDPVLNGGGAVMDFGCYGANLATWLLDGKRPSQVFAVLQRHKPEVYPKVDDDATIVLVYPGTTVQINASWCWPYNRKDLFIYGKDGFLYQPDPTHLVNAPGKPAFDAPALRAPLDNPFRYLTAVVRGELEVSPADLASLENNLVVMEILSAAVKSARTGTPVKLKAHE